MAETEKSFNICSQRTELFRMSRCFAPIMIHTSSDVHLTAANLCRLIVQLCDEDD
jgi:hypothetical protein